jgi:tetratricopeptide (TPR) repeat protein
MIDEAQFKQAVHAAHRLILDQQYEAAALIQKDLCSQAEQLYGAPSPQVAWAYGQLGNLLRQCGRLEEAEKAAMHGSLMTRLSVGMESPMFAHDLINIGRVFHDKKEFSDARDLFREALRILVLAGAVESHEGVGALFYLAGCCVRLGIHDEADQARHNAKEVFRKHPELRTDYFGGFILLARAYDEAGLPAKFARLMEEFNREVPPDLLKLAQG